LFVRKTQNIMERWAMSGCVATSFRHLAETSQTVSTEIQLRVEIGEP